MKKKLLLATHNKHKASEFTSMMGDLSLEVLTLDGFPQVGEIIEDGETLEANALKKAKEVFRLTGVPSLADDTGLEVYYLNGDPGVYSARYAGLDATYNDNCQKLLKAMQGVPARRRGARFRAVLAFVAPEIEKIVEGCCYGSITEEPKGTGGFGYDPLFIPSGQTKTYAELDGPTKNSLSHRGLALRAMHDFLLSYYRHI